MTDYTVVVNINAYQNYSQHQIILEIKRKGAKEIGDRLKLRLRRWEANKVREEDIKRKQRIAAHTGEVTQRCGKI